MPAVVFLVALFMVLSGGPLGLLNQIFAGITKAIDRYQIKKG